MMANGQPGGASGAVGPLLRRYREAAGLSQEALAELAGLSPRGLLYLERGVHRPYPATLRRLADALSLSTHEREALAVAARRSGAEASRAAEDATARPQPAHNLPASLSSFIGREEDQAKVHALLAAHRLVTLVGAGGVGKTRLALAVAEGILCDYPDGVWLVELAALADPGLVPATAAQALRVHEEPGRPVLETLRDHCRDKRLVFVLDNCEHLLPACAALAGALLRAAPALRILATSREPLRVTGEQGYRVPSLSVPDPRRLPAGELAGIYEAVRLFVQRARERRPDFTLDEHNARATADVCARLDGIPLAVELAAARVGGMGVEALAARLDDRFRLLTEGARDALPRQRTLRATLDWSYDLLNKEERILLGRLAVFAGGWTLAAAEAVCPSAELAEQDVLALLDRLVSKSLVQPDETAGEVRYRLLDTIRQYAGERLARRNDTPAVRDRHLGWCLAMAEEAASALKGPGQVAWLTRLDAEHDNLRAALGWARERGAVGDGLRLAGALWRFWSMRDYFSEGRRWLEAALAAGQGPPAARATALNAAGELAAEQGDFGREVMLQTEALALWRTLRDRAGISASLDRLAWVASLQGDFRRAVALREECLALQRDLGDSWDIARSLNHLAWMTALQGDYALATALNEEVLSRTTALGDSVGIEGALSQLGWVAALLGDFGRAVAQQEAALARCREMGYRSGMAASLNRLGWVVARQGNLDRAEALLEEALALQRELGDRRGTARSLGHLGAVVGEAGDHARALALLTESLRISRDVVAMDLMAEGLASVAHLFAARGQPRRAAQLAGAAEAERQKLGMPLPPVLRPRHEQLLLAARAALGDAAFETAWIAGRAMTLTEALALALRADSNE